LISDSRLSNQDLVLLWHRRLGHPGHGAIDRLIKDHPELQVFKPRQLKDLLCETCAYAKSRRSPFNSSAFSVRVPFFPLSILTFGVHAPFPLLVEADILLFL
ncbi:hypothetical protein AeMF1_019974, partial [Aphanomyces euteiches]